MAITAMGFMAVGVIGLAIIAVGIRCRGNIAVGDFSLNLCFNFSFFAFRCCLKYECISLFTSSYCFTAFVNLLFSNACSISFGSGIFGFSLLNSVAAIDKLFNISSYFLNVVCSFFEVVLVLFDKVAVGDTTYFDETSDVGVSFSMVIRMILPRA